MKQLIRLTKYSMTSLITFVFDLSILYLLVDKLSLYYLFASILSFFTASSINYALARRFVFRNSQKGLRAGYYFFASSSVVGLIFVTIGMFISVEFLEVNYIVARVAVVFIVFIINYFINSHFNFRVLNKF